MPTIEVNKKDLEQLIGKSFSIKELEDLLLYVKGEIDSIEGNKLKIDIKETNRPDLWSTEGIAREIKLKLGIQKGIKKYVVGKPVLTVTIDKSVKKIRPFTVSAVVKGLNITEDFLIQLIQLQEKIDGTFGRKRSQSSIGIYDFDKIKGNIVFYGAKPTKKFIPLGFSTEMTLDEILAEHPKGKEYGHLLKGKELYPIFEDQAGNVLSMPPIINSNYSGKVTEKTKNLFVEVSGLNFNTVNTVLKVIVMALADRNGKIEGVLIKDGNKKFVSPSFGTKKMNLSIDFINKITGLNLNAKQIISILLKSGMKPKIKGKNVLVEFPDFRQDILHPIDIVEDILISFGYNKIQPLKVELPVIGSERKESLYLDKVREACIGMQLQEILSFVLTSKEKQLSNLMINDSLVEIANAVSKEYCVMRKRILPEVLEFFFKNKKAAYPQKVFEIGRVLCLDESKPTKVRETENLCIALTGKNIDFNSIKSHLNALAKNLNFSYSLTKKNFPFFKEGLSAEITIGKNKGFIGILNDKAKKNFGLEQEVAALEIELLEYAE